MGIRRVLALGCAAVLVLGACGDDDDAAEDPDTTEEATDASAEDSDVLTLTAEDFSGGAEVPGPGDEDASGSVERLEIAGGELCVTFAIDGLDEPAVAAHVHTGTAAEAGGVLVNLGEPADAAAGSWDTCVPIDDATVTALSGDPAGHYLNVHTPGFPDGAARAQLTG